MRCHGLILIVAVLISIVAGDLYNFTTEQVKQIEKIPIGKTGMVTMPAGDGCNTCSASAARISETEVQIGRIWGCTLIACPLEMPTVKFK